MGMVKSIHRRFGIIVSLCREEIVFQRYQERPLQGLLGVCFVELQILGLLMPKSISVVTLGVVGGARPSCA